MTDHHLPSWKEVLEGERLLDDFAKRGIQTWASPDSLKLLLIRRDPKLIGPECWIETPKRLGRDVNSLMTASGRILATTDFTDAASSASASTGSASKLATARDDSGERASAKTV